MDTDKRTCTKCNETKDISEFHKTSRKYLAADTKKEVVYSYYHAKCKECRIAERNAVYWETDRFYQGRKIGGKK